MLEPLAVDGAGETVSLRLDGTPGAGPLLVYGHGAGAGIDHPSTAATAAAFAEAGVVVLRYQFPFMERRGGVGFGRDPLPLAVATVHAALARGRTLAGGKPLLVGGHSYGARMATHALAGPALAAGDLRAAVAGAVLLSFPLHGAGKASTTRAAHLASLRRPMLFVSGARDAMATAPLFEDVVAACADAQLLRIEGADHGWKAPKRIWPQGARVAAVAAAVAWIRERGWLDA